MPFVDGFPVHKIIITDSRIKVRPQGNIERVTVQLVGRDTKAYRANVFICQAGDALTADLQPYPLRALPLDGTREYAVLHIKSTLVAQDSSPVEAEVLVADAQAYWQPVRGVGQFLLGKGNGVENAVQ